MGRADDLAGEVTRPLCAGPPTADVIALLDRPIAEEELAHVLGVGLRPLLRVLVRLRTQGRARRLARGPNWTAWVRA